MLSVDPEIDPDIPAMIGASAALSLSGIPFKGPIGAARVGYLDGQYVINPTATQLKASRLNLVVAGTERAVLMVESEADQLPEDVMLGAVMHGHAQMQAAINAIHELVRDAGKPVWDWQPATQNEALTAKLIHIAGQDLKDAYQIRNKQARSQKIKDVEAKVAAALDAEAAASGQPRPDDNAVDAILFDLQAKIVRGQILNGEPRIDGRDTRTIRPIEIRLGVLPRTHGSALFTRGETQALVTATLGTKQDEQIIDALHGRVPRALHDALQHAAVRHRRDRPRRHAEAPRDRPRPPRRSARCSPCCRATTTSSTRCASSPRSPSRTARRRWRRSAAAAWR